jgi:hypothetical protein
MLDRLIFDDGTAGDGKRRAVSPTYPLPVSFGAPQVGGTMTATDKTITSATGASQTLAAAAAGRRAILIKAGASSVGVNLLGGTAAIGGAGTITLAPLEGIFLDGASCPVGAITIITTATAYVSAIEYT